MNHVHVWKKMGTSPQPPEKPVSITRTWNCRCGASKTVVKRGDKAPRVVTSREIRESATAPATKAA
jgi:hypothetical protein